MSTLTPATPWRDDTGTTPGTIPATGARSRCPVCAAAFTPAGRQAYCSVACRKRAFRRRHPRPATAPVVPTGTRREHTVYECPECGQRQVGVQRCADCGIFGRAAGLGGACPSCGESVTAAELGLGVSP